MSLSLSLLFTLSSKKPSLPPFFPSFSLSLHLLSFKKSFPSFFRRTTSHLFLSFLPSLAHPFFQKTLFPFFLCYISSSLMYKPFLSLSLSHPFFQLSQPRCTVLLPPRPPFFPRTLASLPSLSIHPFSLSLSDDGGRDGGGGGGERAQLGGWNGWIRSVGIATRCRP